MLTRKKTSEPKYILERLIFNLLTLNITKTITNFKNFNVFMTFKIFEEFLSIDPLLYRFQTMATDNKAGNSTVLPVTSLYKLEILDRNQNLVPEYFRKCMPLRTAACNL